jgi:hypothetical protein
VESFINTVSSINMNYRGGNDMEIKWLHVYDRSGNLPGTSEGLVPETSSITYRDSRWYPVTLIKGESEVSARTESGIENYLVLQMLDLDNPGNIKVGVAGRILGKYRGESYLPHGKHSALARDITIVEPVGLPGEREILEDLLRAEMGLSDDIAVNVWDPQELGADNGSHTRVLTL